MTPIHAQRGRGARSAPPGTKGKGKERWHSKGKGGLAGSAAGRAGSAARPCHETPPKGTRQAAGASSAAPAASAILAELEAALAIAEEETLAAGRLWQVKERDAEEAQEAAFKAGQNVEMVASATKNKAETSGKGSNRGESAGSAALVRAERAADLAGSAAKDALAACDEAHAKFQQAERKAMELRRQHAKETRLMAQARRFLLLQLLLLPVLLLFRFLLL